MPYIPATDYELEGTILKFKKKSCGSNIDRQSIHAENNSMYFMELL
jgi:hypothetical protein